MSKLVSNYVFNVLYQILLILLPLISTPYVARALNPEGVGISAYATSVVQIFILFSMLGIQIYGNKQIASTKHLGKRKMSNEFWSIYFIQIISSIICIIIYLLFVYYYIRGNNIIFYIQVISLIGTLFDISWLFLGLEKLKSIVIRNSLVKIISLFLIIMFVKTPSDVIVYITINVVANTIGQLVMWFNIFPHISLTFIKIKDINRHLKPIMLIFIPLMFIQVYTVYNKILLGNITNAISVGYYDQAVKIIQLTLTLVTSVGTVMLPRISSEFAKGNINKINFYISNAIRFVLFISIPMCIGLIIISSELVPWFLGPNYDEVVTLIKILSPIIIFIGCANVFSLQILIPTEQQNKYTVSIFIGAVVSLLVNLYLVRIYGAIGTAIALLCAEGIGFLVQAFFVKNYLNSRILIKYIMRYLITSVLMGIFVTGLVKFVNFNGIYLTFFEILMGIVFYLTILYLLKDDLIRGVIEKIKT